jgi:predicted membrane-bound spermidine synthase
MDTIVAERDDYRVRLKGAIEFCKREEKMTSFLLTLVEEARKQARNYRRVLLDNYGDAAVQALFAEDDCYFYWLREDDKRPQEVATDDD